MVLNEADKQYIIPSYATFASEWEKLASASAATETFALSSSESLREACKSLIEGESTDCGKTDFSLEHGGSWRNRITNIPISTHSQPVGYRVWRRRQGASALSHDFPSRSGCNTRVGGPGRKGGGHPVDYWRDLEEERGMHQVMTD